MSIELEGIGMTSQRTRDRLIQRLREEGIHDERVLAVMRNTPRHIFMDEALATRAYENTPLPIGYGQTISQPYIVARMTEALLVDGIPENVFEVGTGSGYQTAILAQLIPQVFSVERIHALADIARSRMHKLKLNNVQIKHSDGSWGWQVHAPYDAIMVTAAPEHIPDELMQQLANDGGRMVIPVGAAGSQRLLVIIRQGDKYETDSLDWVSFVPLRKGET